MPTAISHLGAPLQEKALESVGFEIKPSSATKKNVGYPLLFSGIVKSESGFRKRKQKFFIEYTPSIYSSFDKVNSISPDRLWWSIPLEFSKNYSGIFLDSIKLSMQSFGYYTWAIESENSLELVATLSLREMVFPRQVGYYLEIANIFKGLIDE